MDGIAVRPLAAEDRAAWEPLWLGYQRFYAVDLGADVTEATWQRILDPAAPVYGLAAFARDAMVGIAHYIFHPTTWSAGPRCYLNDIFTAEAARGRGVGRRLIEAVYVDAAAKGADRVYWLTHESNTTARRLYDQVAERSGFIQYRKTL